MPYHILIDQPPDPVPTSFPHGDDEEAFETLIKRALKEDRLWVMTNPPGGESYQGPLKYGRLHTWVTALERYKPEDLFGKGLAFAISENWLKDQKLPLAFVTDSKFEIIYEDAWQTIFMILRMVGINAIMLYNVNDFKKGCGHGLAFLSETDAILGQAMIEQIDFNLAVDEITERSHASAYWR